MNVTQNREKTALHRIVFFFPMILIGNDFILGFLSDGAGVPAVLAVLYIFGVSPALLIIGGWLMTAVFKGRLDLTDWLDKMIAKVFFPIVYVTSIPYVLFVTIGFALGLLR